MNSYWMVTGLRIGILSALLVVSGCGPASVAVPETTTAPSSASQAAGMQPTSAPKPTQAMVTAGSPVALRDDIQIRNVLETGGGFVRLKLDPLTQSIYYLDGNTNIYRLEVQQGSGSRGVRVYNATDVGGGPGFVAAGMAFGPDGTLYVLGNISGKNTTHVVIRKGTPGSGNQRTWSTLAESAPYEKSNTQFDHVFNGIVVSPDGRYVYVNSGSRTDHGEVQAAEGAHPDAREVPLTSAIFRIPTDAGDQLLPNDEAQLKAKGYLFADGVRNAYDLAFGPGGDLFGGDNGPDADYPDELNWLREGHHYGFPWRLGNIDNPQQRPDYDPARDRRLPPDFFAIKNGFYHNDPAFPPPPQTAFTDPVVNLGPDADVIREEDGSAQDLSDRGQPAYTFTPHRSPLGLVFDTAGVLSGPFKGSGFVLSWGAAAGDLPDPGQDLLHVQLEKAGDNYQAHVTQLVVGFDKPIDAALLQNKLYVLDWGGKGTIWEVTFPQSP